MVTVPETHIAEIQGNHLNAAVGQRAGHVNKGILVAHEAMTQNDAGVTPRRDRAVESVAIITPGCRGCHLIG